MRILLLFLLCFSFLLHAEKISTSSTRPGNENKPNKEILIGNAGSEVGDVREDVTVEPSNEVDFDSETIGDSANGDSTDPEIPSGDSTDPETPSGDSGDSSDPETPGGDSGDSTDDCGGCGLHGVCDTTTLTCVCMDEYYGPMCVLRDCGEHGAYSSLTESCVCEPGYFGALCNECGGAPNGEKFLCMGRADRYNIVPFRAKEAKGLTHLTALGFNFFTPGTDPDFDCACKHIESAAARHLPRVSFRDLSEQEILDAFNAISVEMINQQQTTSEELAEIVRANNRDRNDCKWETIVPILILGLIGTLVLAIILVIVIVWSLYMTRPRKQKD